MAVNRPVRPMLAVVDDSGDVAAPIAAALACAMLPPVWRVVCRSLAPAREVHPLVREVMGEWGLEMEPWVPTGLAPGDLDGATVVMVLTSTLPSAVVPPTAESLRWPNCGSPVKREASPLARDAVRSLRDRIRGRLEEWAVERRL